MQLKRLSTLLVALAVSGTTFAAEPPSGLQIRTTRPGASLTFEKSLADGKVLVSVLDAKQEPVLGLTAQDFEVTRADATATITSVEPISQNIDVPRHVVLVVDNSYSLEERKVIAKELGELGAVLKTIRPIDDVQMVVMRDGKTVKMGGRNVHVEVIKSNKPSELGEFAAKACGKKSVTDNTYLNEEMFAGVELIKGTPADGPRFLWVFTDGEELNSAFKSDVVSQAAQGVENLSVLAIDCMPGPNIDGFLEKFASQHHGQARKAGKGADLLALFQQSGSKTEHHYVVNYEFAPPPAPAAAPPPPSPKRMVFNEVALFDFNKAVLKPEGKEQIKAYREKTVAEMSSAEKVKITGYTDNIGTAAYNKKLSLRRAEAVRDYLVSLGADPAKLEVIGEGMANPVADNSTAEGRAKNRRVEVEVTGLGK
jgi:outer membrane protein OmpA-like peptidoglycan-associated protein